MTPDRETNPYDSETFWELRAAKEQAEYDKADLERDDDQPEEEE